MKHSRTFQLFVLLLTLFWLGCTAPSGGPSDSSNGTSDHRHVFHKGGAPIQVAVELSNNQLRLTDFLEVTIEVKFSEELLITPLLLSESVYHPLLLVEKPEENTFWSETDRLMVHRWSYRFEPVYSGEFHLESFSVGFRLEKEKTSDPANWPVYTLETEKIPYTVVQPEIDQFEDIKAIKGLIAPPFRYSPLIITGLLIGILLLVLLALERVLKRKRPGTDETAKAKDFFQEALNRIADLERRDLITKEAFDQFHTELADILREFIEQVYQFKAKEQTTEEFIKGIADSRHFTEEQRQMFKRFLHLADLVKFATYNPGSKISGEALVNVKSFIESSFRSHEN